MAGIAICLLAFDRKPTYVLPCNSYGYFKSLNLYEVDNVVIEEISATKFGINSGNIIAPAIIVSQTRICEILHTADIIVDA